MTDLFEKGLLAGIGLADLTREKVADIVEELVTRGDVTRKEGTEILQQAMERGQREKKRGEERLGEALDAALARLNLARREDLLALERRVAILEGKLATGETGKL